MESIYGPGLPRMTPPIRPTPSPDQDVHGTGSGDATAVPSIPAEPQRLPRATEALEPPEGPPPGVDADLWSVLTAEEREFFSVAREMGPITYGRDLSAANETSLPRGRRLDVRA